MIELFLPSWIGGIILALAAGPLGSFIVWRRMSYFGDTLAHSSLLGIASSLILEIDPYYTAILLTVILALTLTWLEKYPHLGIDTLLGIIAHSTLSLGLVIISLIPSMRADLTSYLFGDLLAIMPNDLWVISIGVLVVLIAITTHWNSLLSATISPELATIEGVNIRRINFLLMLVTAFTISIAMKFFGILIITSLLIIPAASARNFAHSPESMVLVAIMLGIFAITCGIFFSVFYDTPAGASVVLCSTLIFILSMFGRSLVQKNSG